MKHKKIFKSSNIEIKSSDEENRVITAIASKEVKDRDGDVVVVGTTAKDGIDIRQFKKNPVILFAHDHRAPPIARAEKIWKEDKKLMMNIKFPEPEISSLGDSIYKLIKGGYMNTLSIGFQPDWQVAKFDEKKGGYYFPSSELLETSIVSVPANPEAIIQSKSIQKAVSDNVIDEAELNEMKIYLEELYLDNELDKQLKEIDDVDKQFDEIIADEDLEELENTVVGILIDEMESEQTQNVCDKCGQKIVSTTDINQKEDDSDLFDWIFNERLTEKSNDDSIENLVDELLNYFSQTEKNNGQV